MSCICFFVVLLCVGNCARSCRQRSKYRERHRLCPLWHFWTIMNEDTEKLIINIIAENTSHFDSVSRNLRSKFVARV